jgi:hypothetical protein
VNIASKAFSNKPAKQNGGLAATLSLLAVSVAAWHAKSWHSPSTTAVLPVQAWGRAMVGKQRYPDAPGFKGASDGTSADGARYYAPQVIGRRRQVLDGVSKGPATAEQIGERVGLHWYLTRPRLSVNEGGDSAIHEKLVLLGKCKGERATNTKPS